MYSFYPHNASQNPFEMDSYRSAGPIVHMDLKINMNKCVVDCSQEGPPLAPEYTACTSCVVQDLDVSSIWSKLTNFLRSEEESLDKQQSMDFVPQKDEYQIHGLCVSHGRAMTWNLAIYQRSDGDGLLVECSKHSGSALDFNQFYRKISALWKPQSAHLKSPRFMVAPKLELKQDRAVDEQHLDSLLAMAGSGFYQQQMEGLGALAFASSRFCNRRYLSSKKAAAQVISITKAALKSADNELMRSGAALLKNLCQEQSICSGIQDLAPVIESCMEDMDNIDNSESDDHFTFLYQSLI